MGACASSFKISEDAGDAPVKRDPPQTVEEAANDDVAPAAEDHETKRQSLDLLLKVDGSVELRKQENEPEFNPREIEIVNFPELVIEARGGDELQKLQENHDSIRETKTDVDAKPKPEFQALEADDSGKKVLEKPVEVDNTVNVEGSLEVVEALEIEKSNATEKMKKAIEEKPVETEKTEVSVTKVEHGNEKEVDPKPAMDQQPEKENEIEEKSMEKLERSEKILEPEEEKSSAEKKVETKRVGDDTKKLEISPEVTDKQDVFEPDEIEKLVASN